ncbi:MULTISPECIES: GlxA family transcriptional regulator [Agrobacterium tumefaciens complex]|jgi:transcriptional regulator GlxA family with amidase domain|uniref:AraC family transcriptional regulator n=1 Tax=Agrobacterium tumefaciens str. Kerr 14 TaxID=1183424 RepID=A0A1S7S8G5_AGRTU|nr:GlxA family transcriptional regulator [Agrobacterium tumefaciens]AYM84285.1 AraC family transcriptional regulator [Agrobacterium tumefaciens]NTE94503.1 GlxA family transcriptional regulator [Agrobacterium tumefaciens]CUX64458.1 AraC family transcriptional regulator [Agrobacterium tumefaciens str. Kerr 14]
MNICVMTSHRARKRLSVAFLLADRFTLSAFANFVDVLRLAADEADRSRPILCEWSVLSATLGSVQSSCGVKVQPDTRLMDAGHYDYIVVVGGLISDHSALPQEALRFLKDRAAAGIPIVGLCTGVFILHEAGLLDGYRCCVSWFHHQDFLDRFDTVQMISDQIFVIDRDRLTCSGGHGAAHLAAFLVERHVGQSAAIKSLNIMMIDSALSGEKPQPGQQSARKANDPLVRKTILRMQQNIEVPKTVLELANDLGLGRRSLERRFLTDLNATPSKVYLELRLDRALSLLRTTHDPITQIALATGFCDAPHLSRTLRTERGFTPSEYRKTQAGHTTTDEEFAVGVLLPQS